MLTKFSTGFFLLIVITVSQIASAAYRCEVESTPGTYDVTISIEGKKIYILGWQHITEYGLTKVTQARLQALPFASARDCKTVQATLAAGVQELQKDFVRANQMHSTLEKLHAQSPLSAVAIELAPFEIALSSEKLKISREQFDFLIDACGEQVSVLVKESQFMLNGPEYSFVQSHAGVELLAVENDAA